MSIFHPVVQFADNVTGGLFKRRWNDGMNQCGKTCCKKFCSKPAGKTHVLEIGFINSLWMLDEQAID